MMKNYIVFAVHKSQFSLLWHSDRRAVHYSKIFNKFVKYPSQVLARADLIPALIEVHFGSADKEQMECVLLVSFNGPVSCDFDKDKYCDSGMF